MTRADPAQRPTAISPSAGTVVFRGGMAALLESSGAGHGAAGLRRLWPHRGAGATAADYGPSRGCQRRPPRREGGGWLEKREFRSPADQRSETLHRFSACRVAASAAAVATRPRPGPAGHARARPGPVSSSSLIRVWSLMLLSYYGAEMRNYFTRSDVAAAAWYERNAPEDPSAGSTHRTRRSPSRSTTPRRGSTPTAEPGAHVAARVRVRLARSGRGGLPRRGRVRLQAGAAPGRRAPARVTPLRRASRRRPS